MSTALITGCDYGIGFEFARQFAEDGWRVHAICLDPASQGKLEALGDVRFHHADVSDEAAVNALAAKLEGEGIDLLINNAATFAPNGPGTLQLPDKDEFMRVMRVNAVAPIYVANAFEHHVAASARKLMIFIGTRSGSIGDNGSGGALRLSLQQGGAQHGGEENLDRIRTARYRRCRAASRVRCDGNPQGRPNPGDRKRVGHA